MIKPDTLPADPDGMNETRASCAQAAIDAFRDATGTDEGDALPDLLCNLMHWADRNPFDFDAMMIRAREHYASETKSPHWRPGAR